MAENTKITIEDIARHASVSISTVSRVINGTASVADETRAKILRVIADLNYQPNHFAQGLAGGQSRTIGVLTQLIGSPFYDVILRGILSGINGSGYSPIFADGNWDADKDLLAMQTFLQRKVDGLIVLGGASSNDVLINIASKIPTIIVGKYIPELAGQCLPFDDFDAAYRATKYLIDSGHRQIAHITGLLIHKDAIDRRDGYLKALEESAIETVPDLIVEGDFTEPSGMMAMEMLLARGKTFSAIFAANDQMAYGARLALYRRGLRVPDDVSIIGFDDQAPSAYMVPPLTSVRRPPLEIGEAVAKALLSLMRGEVLIMPGFKSTISMRESVSRR